ncbi:MAG: transposase [Candidatus Staskawiczbacteria bacterium]|nr:transposase [Candidatus Staskawiczbacteria bacterium]
MSYQRPKLVNDEYYHVVVRAVGDTVIFVDESDFYRGIFSIYEFNNDNSVNIWNRRKERATEKKKLNPSVPTQQKREKFVDVLTFSFMPNHLHLILKQTKENGISKFMQKVGTGYANYFNKKYNRMGHLFNKFGAVHISGDNQLRNTFTYVHTNLISIIEPGWKEKGIINLKKVKEFLENSKRHSYPDYLGKSNFSSVTERDFLSEAMGGIEGCKAHIDGWIMHKKVSEDFAGIILE